MNDWEGGPHTDVEAACDHKQRPLCIVRERLPGSTMPQRQTFRPEAHPSVCQTIVYTILFSEVPVRLRRRLAELPIFVTSTSLHGAAAVQSIQLPAEQQRLPPRFKPVQAASNACPGARLHGPVFPLGQTHSTTRYHSPAPLRYVYHKTSQQKSCQLPPTKYSPRSWLISAQTTTR